MSPAPNQEMNYEFPSIFNSPLKLVFEQLPQNELDHIENIYLRLRPKPKTVFIDVFFLYLMNILKKYNPDYPKLLLNFWKNFSHKIIIPYFVYTAPRDYDLFFNNEKVAKRLLEYALSLDPKDPNSVNKYIFMFEIVLDEIPKKMTKKEFLVFNTILNKRITKASQLAKYLNMNESQASRIFNALFKRRILVKKGVLNINRLGFDIYLVTIELKKPLKKRIFKTPWTYSEVLSINDYTKRYVNLLLPRKWVSQFSNPYKTLRNIIMSNEIIESADVFLFKVKGANYNFSNYDYRTGQWKPSDYDKVLKRWNSGKSIEIPEQPQNQTDFVNLDKTDLEILETIWDYGPLPVKELRKIMKINYNNLIKRYNKLKEHFYFFESVFPSYHFTQNEIFLMAKTDIDEWKRTAYALMEFPILYYGLYLSENIEYYGVYHIRTSENSVMLSSIFMNMIKQPYMIIFNEITKEKIWSIPINRWNEEKQCFEIHEDDFLTK